MAWCLKTGVSIANVAGSFSKIGVSDCNYGEIGVRLQQWLGVLQMGV